MLSLNRKRQKNLLNLNPIGLGGEEAVSFLKKKRPVFKGKNIFFKNILFMKRAKLNKKFVKKFIFEKKIKFACFWGQNHLILGIFFVF